MFRIIAQVNLRVTEQMVPIAELDSCAVGRENGGELF